MAEKFGPDIVIPPDARDFAIWTEISSTDDSGVTIQGIKKDDTIEIESIAGICSFSEQTTGRRVLSIVGIVGGVLGATTGIAATAGKLLKNQAGSIKAEAGNASAKGDGGGKRRDGYGKDVGGKEFAANEGGIIVCMPSARGPIVFVYRGACCWCGGRSVARRHAGGGGRWKASGTTGSGARSIVAMSGGRSS